MLLAGACTPDAERASRSDQPVENTSDPTESANDAPVYAAVGASETAGWGARNPSAEAWPQVLGDSALPRFEIVNLGIPGATVEDALARELPKLRDAEPELVTVWLNANDILRGITLEDYERGLDRLLRGIQETQPRQVLVANTPPLDALPAYRACRPNPPEEGPFCFLGESLPSPRAMRTLVERFNVVIDQVVERRDATLVDLFSGALEAQREGTDANLVSRDGLHPSTEGHHAIAESFANELERP